MIFVLTDGAVENQETVIEMVTKQKDWQVFTVGIGMDVEYVRASTSIEGEGDYRGREYRGREGDKKDSMLTLLQSPVSDTAGQCRGWRVLFRGKCC